MIKRFLAKAAAVTGLLLVSVIFLQLIRTLYLYSNDTNKIIGYYTACVLSAVLFVWLAKKYRLKTPFILFGIFALTFLYQFIFSQNVYMKPDGDLYFYFTSAVNFTNDGFTKPLLYQSAFPTTATYPAFLSVFMRIFGTGRMVPVYLNIISMSGLSCLVYVFCKSFMPVSFSLSAALLVCLHPFTIIYSNACNAELIYGVIIFTAFCVTMKSGDFSSVKLKPALTAFAGILCGVSNLFRPLGIIMLVALLMHILLFSEGKLRVNALLGAVMLAAYMLTQMGNLAIQEYITKYPPASDGYGWNLYIGASPSGKWNNADGKEFNEKIQVSSTPAEVHEYFAEKGFERYKKMGLDAIQHVFRKLSPWYAEEYIADEALRQETYSPFYTPYEKRTYLTLITIVDLPVFLSAIAVCMWIFFSSLRNRTCRLMPLALYLLGSFMTLMVLEMSPRYSVSYRQIFCVFAVYGVYLFMQKRAARKKRA